MTAPKIVPILIFVELLTSGGASGAAEADILSLVGKGYDGANNVVVARIFEIAIVGLDVVIGMEELCPHG